MLRWLPKPAHVIPNKINWQFVCPRPGPYNQVPLILTDFNDSVYTPGAGQLLIKGIRGNMWRIILIGGGGVCVVQ